MDVASRLRKLREQSCLSQAELARRANIGQGSISAIESGKQSPTVDTLLSLCSVLGVTLSDFFDDDLPTPELPPHIQELVYVAKDLEPEQLAHLTEFIKSITNEGGRSL